MSAWAELVCFLASFFLVSLIDAILSVFLPMFFSGKNCWCLLWIELAFFLVYVFLVSSIDAKSVCLSANVFSGKKLLVSALD